ncbi:FAD-dependent monooxygenase [Nonomuraea jabiensis]|uniref:FAD-dependent monooxygenase n=1 Tax=Nonomuraea jabiensis TaxID=882448 RepID=UPI003D7469C9
MKHDDGGAELDIPAPDGERLWLQAEFVVGTDGGRSTVRDLLGVKLEGDTHPRKWLVVDCDNDRARVYMHHSRIESLTLIAQVEFRRRPAGCGS